MQLITVVTVEAGKGIRWIKSLLCVNELCQLRPGTTASFDMIRQDYLCVCVQLLSLPSRTHELGHQTIHAWHFKEEAICWKQAPHLDYVDPRIELCPESLPISPKPGLVHSSALCHLK